MPPQTASNLLLPMPAVRSSAYAWASRMAAAPAWPTSWNMQRRSSTSDQVVEDKGVRVGYKVETACGCGESVQLTPATVIPTRHADGVREMLAVSLLKTVNPGETPGFLWLAEF